MGNIYCYSVPGFFNTQIPLWPVHGCWIDRVILFTFSDDGFHSGLRDPRCILFHKIKCPPHTRMTALSVNNLDLVKPNWAHGRSAGRLHRPSVPLNSIKPPLRHSCQSICLILARFDQRHIHRQRVFFHQFYYRVKPSSNQHLACCFGLYPGFAGKGVRDPFMDTGRIGEQMQGGRLPEDCQVYSFNNSIKFCKLNMLGVVAGRNEQASSTTAPSYTSDTPVARELASTHTLRVWPSTYHLPRAGSILRTLVRTSLIMVLRGTSSIFSSHPAVTSDALRLMNATATRSQPITGKCPTNLLHSENTFRRVMTRGMSGILFPLLQYRELSSPQTCNPSTRTASCCLSGSLLRKPKLQRCSFKRAAGTMLSSTYTSSILADVARCMRLSFVKIASTIVCIMYGATLRPNPMQVKQYFRPLNSTVW